MKLSVIIVNYNVASEVDNCISSVYKILGSYEPEIIVVDNNSTIRDIERLQGKYSFVKFEFLTENHGFGKANNQGVNIAEGDYVLFLNPDTLLIEDFITPMVEFISNNNKAGACGPQLIYPDGDYQNSTGPRTGIFYETSEALMFISVLRKLYWNFYLKNRGDIIPVGWLSAACMLVKKEIFRATGGFDERYFLNYEDIDLCRRFENSGYKNYYFPKLRCVHTDHASLKKDYELMVYSRYESRKIFAEKHYVLPVRIYVNLIHVLGLILRLFTVYFFYSGDELKGRSRGYIKSLKLYLTFI
ncbi:MAG: glycosyltransferase family 2 protein [Ignavibacteria bacterium]|nr:glycosyltransferase family 2 protein [Ignavibacteria bacterium]